MAQEINSPIWDVMLQSAQVINQTAALMQKTQQEQERLDFQREQADNLMRLRQETLDQREKAIEYKRQADEASAAIRQMQANTQLADVQSKIADREYDNARLQEAQEFKEAQAKLKTTTEKSPSQTVNAANTLQGIALKSSKANFKFQDEASNVLHAPLLAMDTEKLAEWEAKMSNPRPLDEFTSKILEEKYPAMAGGNTARRMKDAQAARFILHGREEEYQAIINEYTKPESGVAPGVVNILKLSGPRQIRGERVFGNPPPGANEVRPNANPIQAGINAMSPNVNAGGGPPVVTPTAAAIDPIVTDARKVREMPYGKPEEQAAKVLAAAQAFGKVYALVPDPAGRRQAAEVIMRELVGAETGTDTKTLFNNAFLKLVANKAAELGLLETKGSKAPSNAMKGK